MSASPTAMHPGPLSGLRIIDLTQALAGPYFTMLLADLGADVIKIEPPKGDMTRYGGPFTLEDTERSYGGYFASINRNKRSVVLDLKVADDRDALRALVKSADAMVENSRVGVMDRLDLGYEALAELNPRLVYGAIRGFGDPRTGSGTSPYSEWPAFDVVAQAMGGLVATTGMGPGEQMKCGPSVGDIFPAALAAVGILAALLSAQRTGAGQFVDVAMYDAILSLCENAVYRYAYTGLVPGPAGNGHPVLSPFDIFVTADGACAIAAPTENHWPILCDRMGMPEFGFDERFRTNRERIANRAEVTALVTSWTSTRTTMECISILAGHVPCGPVNDVAAIFADPHVEARDMLVTLEQPDGSRPVQVAGTPIKLTGTKPGTHRRPPRLGEHTISVLAEVGIERTPS